jgi:hypothetical protein
MGFVAQELEAYDLGVQASSSRASRNERRKQKHSKSYPVPASSRSSKLERNDPDGVSHENCYVNCGSPDCTSYSYADEGEGVKGKGKASGSKSKKQEL